MIMFTGDFISYARYLRRLPLLMAPLRAPSGMFACAGNHDHWVGLSDVAQVLARCGIDLLLNEHRTITIRGERLVVAGVDDLWDGEPDLDRALAGAPQGVPVVLLAHSPDYADIAARSPVILQLAGHSHGGHIRLPWLGPLLLPRHGIRHDRGLHRLGNMWLYVSHGLGGWPLRIGCRAEVTLLTLRTDALHEAPLPVGEGL
jgi:predicted MPP superfamily phosphohydrolase